jgi:RNA 3'-terminal phosphate cyclase
MKDGCTITLLKYSNKEIAKSEVQIKKRGFLGGGGGHREYVFDVNVCV